MTQALLAGFFCWGEELQKVEKALNYSCLDLNDLKLARKVEQKKDIEIIIFNMYIKLEK